MELYSLWLAQAPQCSEASGFWGCDFHIGIRGEGRGDVVVLESEVKILGELSVATVKQRQRN